MPTDSLNILTVDDESEITFIVSSILTRAGHRVEIANDGTKGLDLVTRKPGHFHILITDHNMPGLSGLELINEIRKNTATGKIVVLSGSLDSDLADKYRSAGVDKIMTKPFTLDALAKMVQEVAEYKKNYGTTF